jgi:hypothetical protein
MALLSGCLYRAGFITRVIAIVALCILSKSACAQNSTNYLSVYPYNPINQVYLTTTDFETDHSFAYAYILTTYSKSFACHVYARISSYTGPAGYIPTTYPIALEFVSTTSGVASNIATGQLILTGVDQLLFQETKHNQHTFYYNGIIKALDYSYKPGTYNYTITFTMTQP